MNGRHLERGWTINQGGDGVVGIGMRFLIALGWARGRLWRVSDGTLDGSVYFLANMDR